MSEVNGERTFIDFALISKIFKDRMKDAKVLRGASRGMWHH